MSYLIPKSFWTSSFLPSIEDENDWGVMSNIPNGLSLSEDEKSVYVEAAMPGIEPKDIDLTYERGMLKIIGEHIIEENDKKKYSRKSQSHFSYQLVLPDSVDSNSEPQAEVKNGVIHITFKKSEKVQPKKIAIKGV